MKAVLQVVRSASVECEGRTVSEIDKGFLVLLGVTKQDTQAEADALAAKIAGLRVFADENGKLKLVDLNADIKGAFKINKTDAVTDVPADLDDYVPSPLNDCAEDLLRAAMNTLSGEIGFKINAKVKIR